MTQTAAASHDHDLTDSGTLAAPPDPPARSIPELSRTIEAVLFSTDKPVSIARLAEVLGLGEEFESRGTAHDPDPALLPPETTPPEVPTAQTGTPEIELNQGAGPSSEPAAPEPPAHVEPKPRQKKKKPTSKGPSPAGLIRDTVEHLNAIYAQTGRAFRIEQVAGGYRVMMLPEHAPTIAAFQGAKSRTALSHAALETLAIVSYKQPITRARLEAIRGVACGEILRSLADRRLITIVGRAEEVGRPILYGTTKRFLELFGLSSLKDLPSVEDLRPKT